MLTINTQAPQFTINDQNGNPFQFPVKGKTNILFFYPKDNTPGCTAEACSIRDAYSNFVKKDIEVIGISPDSEKSHQKFIEKQNLPFSLLADTEKTVANLYQVWGKKKFMGREYEGVFRTTFVIDASGMITHIIDKVDTKDAAKQLFEILEA
jgi:peroxiredoxin Q/BCP